ncbi:recombinase family protein [Ideonella sp. B508-1]|uniref:recombinase family protein n=1 Tax=Ideonella sp. B508-1 TaxID=137716 RepID=UPI0003456669|nr:recombinase family protein [Ideonella sp. B508-1]
MPNYYAYLRVSRDTQDVANQRLGLLDYANRQGYAPVVMVEDTVSRSLPWRERLIGRLLTEQAQRGDIVLTAEVTRIAGSPMQVFSLLEVAAERGITIIVTKMGLVLDASLNGQIQAAMFGIASMIEVEFIRARTREGLQRAAAEGRIGGRRPGSTGRLKLDPRKAEVGELHELCVSTPKLAKRFGVTEKTMRKFLARHFPKVGG